MGGGWFVGLSNSGPEGRGTPYNNLFAFASRQSGKQAPFSPLSSMAGIIFYHPKLGEKRSKIVEEAFRFDI